MDLQSYTQVVDRASQNYGFADELDLIVVKTREISALRQRRIDELENCLINLEAKLQL